MDLSYPSGLPTRWAYSPERPAFEEPPHDAPEYFGRTEEAPAADESEAAAEECIVGEEAPAEEESLAEEIPAEECPAAEAAPAEENEIEVTPARKHFFEFPEEEEPVVEDARPASEPDISTEQMAAVSNHDFDASNDEITKNPIKLDNRPGEIVSICTSCTVMLFTEYEGPRPYSFTYLMGTDHESYSWLLHTTCFSCVNRYKRKVVSRTQFGNECMAAFGTAMLSEAFIERTGWFDLAAKACKKPLRILMDAEGRSVAYVKIDTLREETTRACRMRGFRKEMDGKAEILESSVPGGFL